MDDQRLIPDAFLALYRDPRGRLTRSHEALLARHECCEDLCQALLEQVSWLPADHGVAPDELANRVLAAIQDPRLLEEHERAWAAGRLTELLADSSR